MEEFDKDKIVERIRRCLALSESPNEHEAALAMSFAQKMLDKYNLSMSEIATENQVAPELIESEVSYDQRWEVRLYSLIARENFCRAVFVSDVKKVYILGRAPNVDATKEMVGWLIGQLQRIAANAQGAYTGYTFDSSGRLVKGTSTRQYRINFLLGAAQRIAERLREINVTNRAEVPEMCALVLNLNRETEAFFLGKHPDTRPSSYSGRGCHGFAEGRSAADGVSIIAPSRHVSADSGKYLGLGG